LSCNEKHQANEVLQSLIGIWHRYQIPLSSLTLNNVSPFAEEDLDKIKIKSEDIEYCIETILKEAPNEEIAVRQLFLGLCISDEIIVCVTFLPALLI
jgi:hypothetical protein